MNDIQFWYPAVIEAPFTDEHPLVEKRSGTIRVINLDHEPYEININANGNGFLAIFGSHISGNFLCVPNWHLGCELGPYKDRFWNIDSIAATGKVVYEDACAIGNALDLISILIKK